MELTKETLKFTPEEEEAFRKLVKGTCQDIMKTVLDGYVKDIKEYHEQLTRRTKDIKKELEAYADSLIVKLRREVKDESTEHPESPPGA